MPVWCCALCLCCALAAVVGVPDFCPVLCLWCLCCAFVGGTLFLVPVHGSTRGRGYPVFHGSAKRGGNRGYRLL